MNLNEVVGEVIERRCRRMVAKFAAESVRQASITDIHLGFLIAKEIVQGRRTSQCGTNVYLPGSWKVIWQPDSDGFDPIRSMNPLRFAFTKVCWLVSSAGLRSV